MDLTRFKQCAAAFGASRHRWPEREQPLYDQLAPTPRGAAILAEAERADRFLDALTASETDPRLAGQIASLAQPSWRRLGIPAAAFAASAVLGFALGFAQARDDADASLAARLLFGPQSVQEIGL